MDQAQKLISWLWSAFIHAQLLKGAALNDYFKVLNIAIML